MKINNKEEGILIEALFVYISNGTNNFTKDMDSFKEELDLLYKLRKEAKETYVIV